MKKWIIFISICLNGSFLFGQRTANNFHELMRSSNDMMTNLDRAKEFKILLSAINQAGLTQTFEGNGPVTLFAPTDRAFEKLPRDRIDTLLKPNHAADLSYLLSSHVIAGRVTVKDIAEKIKANNGQAIFTTLAGSKLVARINGNRNIVLTDENGGESIITNFDIAQSNGILHIVNAVLMPKLPGM